MKASGSRERPLADGGKLGRELFGLFAIFCGLLLILSLATFDSRDPWLNHVVSGVSRVHNRAGLFGAYLGGLLFDVLGFAAWAVPGFFCLAGARRVLGSPGWPWWRWTGVLLLSLCLSLAGAARDLNMADFVRGSLPGAGNISAHGGGLVGHAMYVGMVGWLSITGTTLVWIFALMLAMQMLCGFSWLAVLAGAARSLWNTCATMAGDVAEVKKPEEDKDLSIYDDAEGPPDRIRPLSGKNAVALPPEQAPRPAQDALVHPALFPSAQQYAPEPPLAAAPPVPPYSLLPEPLPAFRDSHGGDDLPPWVRDFEEDRLGVGAVPPDLPEPDPSGPAKAAPLELSWDFQTDGHPRTDVEERVEDAVARDDEEAAPPASQASLTEGRALPGSSLPEGRALPGTSLPEKAAPGKNFDGASAGGKSAFADALPDGEEAAEAFADDDKARDEALAPVAVRERPTVEEATRPGLVRSTVALIKKPAKVPLPSLELLEAAPPSGGGTPRPVLEAKGRSLMTCLNDFGVQGELVGITPGPVVTMFEVRPAPGVRVSRIANLSDDLALALKAVAVRIQAPVPGTDTVGIEIPNEARETVCLKELLASRVFQESRSLLTLALGKDIAGNPAVADLATMPHLLVAGATGAGKSVGINSIILSLIYKARPDEVKLLLIDPKRVEMAIYADLPHLVHPVVTEMQLAKNALEWAVAEMERRYNDIAKAGVRNIADYNAKIASFGNTPPENMSDLEFMPYLVLIIDELADLMMVAAKEVETSIVRLAQLARAAGIHLILATQRPSVDVVTGLIKANFPCRISFQVTSKHDSRTILDTVGAEHLLGKGDMLFKPGGAKFRRLHGAFVSDRNVLAATDYWRSRLKPEYRVDFSEWGMPESSDGGFNGGGGDLSNDPMYPEAVAFVRQQGKASISLIQRRFRIGFNKAARLVEQMEEDGIIGPADGSKPRPVL